MGRSPSVWIGWEGELSPELRVGLPNRRRMRVERSARVQNCARAVGEREEAPEEGVAHARAFFRRSDEAVERAPSVTGTSPLDDCWAASASLMETVQKYAARCGSRAGCFLDCRDGRADAAAPRLEQ